MNRIAMAVKLRARGSDPLAYCETNDSRCLRVSSARGRLASRFTVWGVRGSSHPNSRSIVIPFDDDDDDDDEKKN